MLWFRVGVFSALGGCFFLSVIMLASVLVMCVNPANGRAMNADPYYNGTLSYYAVVLLAQGAMCGATAFGMILAFKVWRNNHQMDHKLRHLFSIWLLILCTSSLINFILGIMGMINYRQPQEEIMSYYEIFSKYNQDVKFVGSFERYQRENSCCGINGPDDWMMAQLKQGGGGGGGGMGMGGMGGMDSYMGSPSTGKCHLTPPTIPMGCGKKLLDDIHWTMTVYACALLLETVVGIAAAGLGWYSFFYWIEKEVIIIPEDEVSNLIVIEPESSTSSYTTVTATPSSGGTTLSGWSRSNYSIEGSRYSNYTKPPNSRSTNYNSRSTNNSGRSGSNRNGSSNNRTQRTGTGYPYPAPPTYYSGSAPPNPTGTRVMSGHHQSGFVPNTPRPPSANRVSKFSNFSGAIPSVGGPHSAYLSMQMVDPNDETESITRNIQSIISDKMVPHSVSDAVKKPPPLDAIRLHQGSRAPSVVYHANQSHIPTGFWDPAQSSENAYLSGVQTGYGPGSGYVSASGYGPGSGYQSGSGYVSQDVTLLSSDGGGSSAGSSTIDDSLVSGSYMRSSSTIYKKTKRVKKKHSPHHMLHKQEQALGGRVLAEMHVDHSRDPDAMNSNMSTSHMHKGHKAHHATIALIKNRRPPKPKELFSGPEKGHGQTGHLATDILEMSGGAGAAKSMIDNINLPVEHNPSLTDGISEPYLKKLRDKKKKKFGGVDHPDHDHPGHGPVATTMSGVVEAPSIDGSQAQLLVDNLFAPKPKPKPPSEDKIKPHEVNADENEEEDENFNTISHHHHGSHHHGSHHHGSHHHGSHHHGSHHHGSHHHGSHHHGHSHTSHRSNRSKNSHHIGHHHHDHSHAGSHHHSHHHGHEHHHHDHGHHHHGGSVRTHHENHSHHPHHHDHHSHHHPHESHFSHHPHHHHEHAHGHHTAGPSMAHHHHHHAPPTEVLYRSDRPLD